MGFFGLMTRMFVLAGVTKLANEVGAFADSIPDSNQFLVIFSNTWGNADLELLDRRNKLQLPYVTRDFTIASADEQRSLYGSITGLSQGNETFSSIVPMQNLLSIFRKQKFTVGQFGIWPFSNLPDANVSLISRDPQQIFSAAADFIDMQQNNRILTIVVLPRIDVNFIPGVNIDPKLPCRSHMPARQNICVEQTYTTSRRYEAAQINSLIAKATPGTKIIWFPLIPGDDPSRHGYAYVRSSARGRRNSLYGLEMPLLTNFPITYADTKNAIDIANTLFRMAGISNKIGEGVNWLNATDVRNKELRWFTAVAAAGHCMFRSPAYARKVEIDGVKYLQAWDAKRNEVYPFADVFKFQQSRISIPKPFQPKISIAGCENTPGTPLQSYAPAPRQPKLVTLLVLDDVGTEKHILPHAPELSKLFAESVRFSNYHSPAAICTPARSALRTSRSTMELGIHSVYSTDKEGAKVPLGMPRYLGAWGKTSYLPEFMKKNGYTSILVEKDHCGYVDPTFWGFDPDYTCYECIAPPTKKIVQDAYLFPEQASKVGFDFAIKRVNETLMAGNKAFVYIGTKLQHAQIHASPDAMASVDCTQVPSDIPGTPRFDYPTPHQTQSALIRLFDKALANYMAFAEQVSPNSHVFIIVTDNGPESRNADDNGNESSDDRTGAYRGMKRSLLEGGHRVMAAIHGIGVKGNVAELVTGLDIYPTIIDLTGAKDWMPTDRAQFRGLSWSTCLFNGDCNYLRGRPIFMENRNIYRGDCLGASPRFLVAYQEPDGSRDWRMLLGAPQMKEPSSFKNFNPQLLFDVQSDPLQSDNVADLYPEVTQKFIGLLKSFPNYNSRSLAGPLVTQRGSPKSPSLRLGYPC